MDHSSHCGFVHLDGFITGTKEEKISKFITIYVHLIKVEFNFKEDLL